MRKIHLSLLITLFPVSVLAATMQAETTAFIDVPEGAWFSGYVHDATTAGIVSGYKDSDGKLTGRFGPADNVTRGQALKIGVLAAEYDADWYVRAYEHAPSTHWLFPYYTVASAEGFASFYFFNKGTDNPDIPATRAEVAQIIADAFKVSLEMPMTDNRRYRDVNVATSSTLAIEALSRDGIVSGDADGDAWASFRPEEPINRAEMVKMAMKARETYGQPKDTVQNRIKE